MERLKIGQLGEGLRVNAGRANRALALMVLTSHHIWASGHGPIFGMATPTNAKHGFSFDFGIMGRTGTRDTGTLMRGMLGYGVTEDPGGWSAIRPLSAR